MTKTPGDVLFPENLSAQLVSGALNIINIQRRRRAKK